jgi:hypothetical protein
MQGENASLPGISQLYSPYEVSTEQPSLSQRFLRVGRGREWRKDTNIDKEF